MSDMKLDLQLDKTTSSPVDEERARVCEEYRQRLAVRLKDQSFRSIEGFPVGTDEAIIKQSDPPYYTACPNPFIEEWLGRHGKSFDPETDNYRREPFAADISEGKNDPIYNAHTYHTKVPPKAIMQYILHYTDPGDIILDGFCGTGMTGVAAQLCANKSYVVDHRHQGSGDSADKISPTVGARKAILVDLSPAATAIASVYNRRFDVLNFRNVSQNIINLAEEELGWLYATIHDVTDMEDELFSSKMLQCKTEDEVVALLKDIAVYRANHKDSKITLGRINYTVWSDVFICPSCSAEVVFYDSAFLESGEVADTFHCPQCDSILTKRSLEHATEVYFDNVLQEMRERNKQVCVLIDYSVGKRRYSRRTNLYDLALINRIEQICVEDLLPSDPMMRKGGESWGELFRAGYHHGVTHSHHFYTARNYKVISYIWKRSQSRELRWALCSILNYVNKKQSYTGGGGGMPGVLYIASLVQEKNVIDTLKRKVKSLVRTFEENNYAVDDCVRITTQSSTSLTCVSDNSVDYIFVDPPFGSNIMYSEGSFLWESLLRVYTNDTEEAIESSYQKKAVADYQELMKSCFSEFIRVLKPGRWMTVEFHNTSSAVWNAIREAITYAGFVIADIRVLDKKQGSFKQVSTTSAAKVDLIISCYKPNLKFLEQFIAHRGKIDGVIDFLRHHLDMLPVAPLTKDGRIEVVAERTRFMLFDRMIAYYLQRGVQIPVSASEFYSLLGEQFVERDEMYFLPDQAARYDALRVRNSVEQLSVFIRDERSAVQWIRTELLQQQQTLGELTPKYMLETGDWEAHEPRPELRDLLKENFIIDDDGKWRVPDPAVEKDIDALRHKNLMRIFEGYTKNKGQLKLFRKEAILEGFKHCWQTKQYGVIVAVCERIPAKVLQEVPEFVQFYDIAKDLAPAETQQLEFTWEG